MCKVGPWSKGGMTVFCVWSLTEDCVNKRQQCLISVSFVGPHTECQRQDIRRNREELTRQRWKRVHGHTMTHPDPESHSDDHGKHCGKTSLSNQSANLAVFWLRPRQHSDSTFEKIIGTLDVSQKRDIDMFFHPTDCKATRSSEMRVCRVRWRK